MTLMALLRMTVLKLDWWLHLVGGALLACGASSVLPWLSWPSVVVAANSGPG